MTRIRLTLAAAILLASLASPAAAGSRIDGYVVYAGKPNKAGMQRVCATASTVLHAQCLRVRVGLTDYARHDLVALTFDAAGNLTGIAH